MRGGPHLPGPARGPRDFGGRRAGGRPVTVGTVRAGSGGTVASTKAKRLSHLAQTKGFPLVTLAQGGGARIPDVLEAATIGRGGAMLDDARRARRIPLVTAILGDSFGGPSWYA